MGYWTSQDPYKKQPRKGHRRPYLDRTEAGNGFANRFLWVCVRRSKCLPEGGRLQEVNLSPLIQRLDKAVRYARTVGEMRRDDEAQAVWREVYPDLSEGQPGLFGAVTSRAEAQVLRLSCIYALLDCSAQVRKEHLLAALGIWEYCEASCCYIFGDSLGDPLADEILRALKSAPDGLSRTDIRDIFGRHKNSNEVERALAALHDRSLVSKTSEETGGRPIERWSLS